MGIFESYAELAGIAEDSVSFVDEAALAEEMEALEEMESAQNLSDDPEEACIEAMLIGKDNYTNILISVANEEMSYFKEHGEEIVYEGVRLDAFFDKVRSLINKAWEKIKAIFEKALNYVNSWISTDKRFVNKYKDRIKKASAAALKISDSYEVNPEVAKDTAEYKGVQDAVDAVVKSTDEGREKLGKDLGGKALKVDTVVKDIYIGKSKEQWEKDFVEELGLHIKKSFSLKPAEIIDELTDGKKYKSEINNAYKAAKSAIAYMKKGVESAQKKAKKEADEKGKSVGGSYGAMLTVCNAGLSKIQTMQRLQIRALNVYHANCRKCAARAVRGVKEGVDVGASGDTEFAYIV